MQQAGSRIIKRTALAVTFCLATLPAAGFAGQWAGGAAPGRAAADIVANAVDEYGDLTPEEAAGLARLREEEKLARDTYLYLHDIWGLDVFGNIAQSEQRHMDAIAALLGRYGLDDPAAGAAEGEFASESMQALYDALILRGGESETAALAVGATIEDLDIADLRDELAATDHPDIAGVYENLTRGSRNHLRSFVGMLETYGAEYEPQYITVEEFDAIVSTPHERGGNGGRRGAGGGPGYVDADGDGVCDNLTAR